MRKVTANVLISLDGVMQAPGGPAEDRSGGFRHGGWSTPFWDQALVDAMTRYFDTPADLVLGRRTYEIFASHWPSATDEPMADRINAARKYVATRTLHDLDWHGSEVLPGDDAADAIEELKESDGDNLAVHGSSGLLHSLLERDLVDELQVVTFPVVLGVGKRLFEGGVRSGTMRVIDCRSFDTGVVVTTYVRDGDLVPGSFPDEPTEQEMTRRDKHDTEQT
ncbi:dihydrofolate reductase family protein [Gordonia sinesedis]